MTTDQFFDTIILYTQDKYKKIASDLKTNYGKQGSLSSSQATWIKNALKRNKNLRGLEIPQEVQEEMDIALEDTLPSNKLTIDRDKLNDIILEEFGNMITILVNRIISEDK